MSNRILAIVFVLVTALVCFHGKDGYSGQQAAASTAEAHLVAVDYRSSCGPVQSDSQADGSVVLTFADLWAQTDTTTDYDRAKCTAYLTYSMPAGYQVDSVRFTVEGLATVVAGGNTALVTRLRSAGTTAAGVYTTLDQSGSFAIDSNEFAETEICSAGEDIVLKASVVLEAERPASSGDQASIEVHTLTIPALPLKGCTY